MDGAKNTQQIFPIGSAEGRAEAERRIAEAQRTGATKLDLGGLRLVEIPAGLGQLAALQRLSLAEQPAGVAARGDRPAGRA